MMNALTQEDVPASGGGLRRRPPDLVCLSHLRWDFVFQRPQHLMTRWARDRRVFYFEEPVWHDGPPALALKRVAGSQVIVAVPQLPRGANGHTATMLRDLLDGLLRDQRVSDYILWYYTPMALDFSGHLAPQAAVYDCMDELSAFAGAPAGLRDREAQLLRRADVVLTGGRSLYEAKRRLHRNVHPFPSSVDVAHFARARGSLCEPADQVGLPRPRLGFFGVIDERMDLALLAGVADARPSWQLVMVGPVAKIDLASLPQRPNIHYVGQRSYDELPAYLAGWDVALLPFAHNPATRFISPTKTPEYLAAGRPVVSTSIHDVIQPYGRLGLARIADTAEEFVVAIEAALAEDPVARTRAADEFLAQMSWDSTFARMRRIIEEVMPAGGVPCSTI